MYMKNLMPVFACISLIVYVTVRNSPPWGSDTVDGLELKLIRHIKISYNIDSELLMHLKPFRQVNNGGSVRAVRQK